MVTIIPTVRYICFARMPAINISSSADADSSANIALSRVPIVGADVVCADVAGAEVVGTGTAQTTPELFEHTGK